MHKQKLIVSGSWIDVVGLITSAIGATGLINESNYFYRHLIVFGEGIQAVGDALIAIVVDDAIQRKGNWIQAAGAGTTSFGVALQIKKEDDTEGLRIEVLGDTLQAIGAAISNVTEEDELLSLANQLESGGATLEAIGTSLIINDFHREGAIINAIGSWIQATGGTIAAIIETNKFNEIVNNNNYVEHLSPS